jgi:hypothetical protein
MADDLMEIGSGVYVAASAWEKLPRITKDTLPSFDIVPAASGTTTVASVDRDIARCAGVGYGPKASCVEPIPCLPGKCKRRDSAPGTETRTLIEKASAQIGSQVERSLQLGELRVTFVNRSESPVEYGATLVDGVLVVTIGDM